MDAPEDETTTEADIVVSVEEVSPVFAPGDDARLEDARALVTITARGVALPGFSRAPLSLASFVPQLRDALASLADAHGAGLLALPDGSGRFIRFTRAGDTIRITDVASRFQREDPARVIDVEVPRSSLASSFDGLRDAVESALDPIAPHDAVRWWAALFATKEEPTPPAPSPIRELAPASSPTPRADRPVVARASPPRASHTKNTTTWAILAAVLVGSCCLFMVAVGVVSKKLTERFEPEYTPSGLTTETRNGVRVLVHPHVGFALRHPGDDMMRATDIESELEVETRSTITRSEIIVYADAERAHQLRLIIVPVARQADDTLESMWRGAQRTLLARGQTILMEHARHARDGDVYEAMLRDETEEVYTLLTMRMIDHDEQAYVVTMSVVGAYPEGFRPVLDSFAAENAPLGAPHTLDEERRVYATHLRDGATSSGDAPEQPPRRSGFELVRYASGDAALHAYVTKDPGDGQRHPAVLFAHGGFLGIGADCWDEQLSAYAASGVVVMCPSWRGESGNPGRFELLHGELDDARAALTHLRALPYVDPEHVYVMGHSSGGSIALLLATSTNGIRAALSVGGAPDVGSWATPSDDGTFPPYDHVRHEEGYIRSALYFVGDLRTPTFYVEGEEGVANPAMLAAMSRAAMASPFTFRGVIAGGHDHFDVLAPTLATFLPLVLADARTNEGIRITEAELAQALGPQATSSTP